MAETCDIYKAIAAVSADLCKDGISKSRKNAQQGYSFRGIDEVLNALAPLLAKHGLVVLPRMVTRTASERESKSGGVLFSVVVDAEFDFVAASDGSLHTVRTFGEAMDSADKATNKAMSAAYKYAAFLAFCIPTEGDNDADAVTHEPAKRIERPASPVGDAAGTGPKTTASPITARQAVISDAQRKRFYAISMQRGWRADEVTDLLKKHGFSSSAEIPLIKYDALVKIIENGTDA